MSDEGSEPKPEEGKADLPDFNDLAIEYAKQEVRNVLTPVITKQFMLGTGCIDFSSHPSVLPHIMAILKAKGYTIEEIENGPVLPGQPSRPGVRVYLHAMPASSGKKTPRK